MTERTWEIETTNAYDKKAKKYMKTLLFTPSKGDGFCVAWEWVLSDAGLRDLAGRLATLVLKETKAPK